ncbi:unnamed protein product [Albugo candida]|uniref:Histone-lysine N-methyltransferase, H3 lysine-79 specific n=1 Tax=Albugo candida TaxID=65357 RepID=A0A024GT46_9STRA|nr:unnamed protein product [Albugo candida]|eukprot:CCI49520.1 unnamed protein product [Albugo candida]
MSFSGFDNFDKILLAFSQQATKCQKYDPNDEDWQQLLQLSTYVRKEVAQLLQEPKGQQILKDSNALEKIKSLIPDSAKAELENMKVQDFALTILYEQPFQFFSKVYHGFGSEIYGEIDFFAFVDVLQWVIRQGSIMKNEAVFYDLGSGTGKAVIAASLLYNFDKVIGIEALEPLNTFAKKRAVKLRNLTKNNCLASSIEFWYGSFLEKDWTDGTIVFCHATCFSDSDWRSISLVAEKLKQGSYVITASQILQSALFEVVKSEQVKTSWGTAKIYIHRRRNIGRWASKILRGGRASRLDWKPEVKDSILD